MTPHPTLSTAWRLALAATLCALGSTAAQAQAAAPSAALLACLIVPDRVAELGSPVIGVVDEVMVERGEPVLGRWQGIYFCEFDGPRTRELIVRCLDGGPANLS